MAGYSSLLTLILLLILAAASLVMFKGLGERAHELGRFSANGSSPWSLLSRWLSRFAQGQSAAVLRTEGRLLITVEELHRLRDLGVSADDAIIRYVMLRELWIGITVLVCLYSLSAHTATFAAIFTAAAIVLAVWVPRGLLDLRWEARRRALRLEIPIVFGLLSSAVQSGEEVVRVFDAYADILKGKQGSSSFAESLIKAKWCARVAGSWSQGLLQVKEGTAGEVVGEAVGQLATIMRSDTADYKERLTQSVQEAERTLEAELQEHRRLVFAKVVTLMSAIVVGGLLLSGFPFLFQWRG
jgi:hypothetical protein